MHNMQNLLNIQDIVNTPIAKDTEEQSNIRVSCLYSTIYNVKQIQIYANDKWHASIEISTFAVIIQYRKGIRKTPLLTQRQVPWSFKTAYKISWHS